MVSGNTYNLEGEATGLNSWWQSRELFKNGILLGSTRRGISVQVDGLISTNVDHETKMILRSQSCAFHVANIRLDSRCISGPHFQPYSLLLDC